MDLLCSFHSFAQPIPLESVTPFHGGGALFSSIVSPSSSRSTYALVSSCAAWSSHRLNCRNHQILPTHSPISCFVYFPTHPSTCFINSFLKNPYQKFSFPTPTPASLARDGVVPLVTSDHWFVCSSIMISDIRCSINFLIIFFRTSIVRNLRIDL